MVAEGLAGTEEAFAERMNQKAEEIGLTNSNFTNSTGWPDPNHYMTAKDIATLSKRLILDFPDYYPYFAEREFTWHGIKQGNRNPLLYRNMGADGVKTGHTEIAGFGMVASVRRGDRHMLLVVNGLKDMQNRADETTRIIEWGFREFQNYDLVENGAMVADLPVEYGREDKVALTVPHTLKATLAKWQKDKLAVKISYNAPAMAPVAKGAELGKLTASVDGVEVLSAPLVASSEVAEVGFFGRIWTNFGKIFG